MRISGWLLGVGGSVDYGLFVVVLVHTDLFMFRLDFFVFCFFSKSDQVFFCCGFAFFLLFCFLQLVESLEKGFSTLFVENVGIGHKRPCIIPLVVGRQDMKDEQFQYLDSRVEVSWSVHAA